MPETPSRDPIHVAVTCDENYVMPLAAMLASLVGNLPADSRLTIHALGSELGQQSWRNLQASVPSAQVTWRILDLHARELTGRGFDTRAYEHISAVCFFRLLLPELLPADVDKVLYLDSDLIVCRDITPLWQTAIDEVPLAAVAEWDPEACKAGAPAGLRRYRELGIPAERILFNTGVMLMNLAVWRRTHLARRAFAYLRAAGSDLRWYEQEAINVVTDGRWHTLDRCWNVPAASAATLPNDQVSIIHYLTAHKPWRWDCDAGAAAPFFTALDRTAWAGWRPQRPACAPVRRAHARLVKALRKRWHAVDGKRRALQETLAYRRARPRHRPLPGERPSPATGAHEIRLFLVAARADAGVLQVLSTYFDAGVQRAFVLTDCGPPPAPGLPDRYADRVHWFVGERAAQAAALRQLLHRYGPSHWCVLGGMNENLVDERGTPVNLRALCEELDGTGTEVMQAQSADGLWIELAARDQRSRRLFRGTACVADRGRAYDPLPFVSRVVLLRYKSGILLDADGRLCGNARASNRRLWLRSLVG